MANEQAILLSYPTYGPSGAEVNAATYAFFTSGYTPPSTGRSIGSDLVHNRNGAFQYVYDNGPNFHRWDPFRIVMEDPQAFANSPVGRTATQQYQDLQDLWAHLGQLQLGSPDGVYSVYWAPGNDLVREWRRYPTKVGDKIEYSVQVQFIQA
jgi:hypothetical protein